MYDNNECTKTFPFISIQPDWLEQQFNCNAMILYHKEHKTILMRHLSVKTSLLMKEMRKIRTMDFKWNGQQNPIILSLSLWKQKGAAMSLLSTRWQPIPTNKKRATQSSLVSFTPENTHFKQYLTFITCIWMAWCDVLKLNACPFSEVVFSKLDIRIRKSSCDCEGRCF